MPTQASPAPEILPCDKPGSLIIATRRLLERDSRSHHQLAADLKVPYYWLKSFIQGSVEAPSVNRVQYLYEKLSGQKIIF